MHKGDTNPAYKALTQLSKPKCHPGRQLHTASKRITEWLWHVTHLFTATSRTAPMVLAPTPIAPVMLALIKHFNRPPYPEVKLAEIVTAIKLFKIIISSGICNTLPEMLKYEGGSVHSTLHLAHRASSFRTPSMISAYPYLRRCFSVQQLSHHCPSEHSWESLCRHVECMPFTVAGRHPS